MAREGVEGREEVKVRVRVEKIARKNWGQKRRVAARESDEESAVMRGDSSGWSDEVSGDVEKRGQHTLWEQRERNGAGARRAGGGRR